MKNILNFKESIHWVNLLVAICFVIGLLPALAISASATSLSGTDYANGVLAEKLDTVFSEGITSGLSSPFPAVDGTFSKSKMYSITFANTGSRWSGYQCAAYAKAVYNYLFGYDPASESYRQTFSEARTMGNLSFEDFQRWGVKFGAYLRTTVNLSGKYDAFNGHSVIILSYDESSIVTLEANLTSSTLYQTQIKSRTWSNFNSDLFKNRYVCSLSQPLESIYDNLDFGNCTNHTYEAERCTNCGATVPYDNRFDASAAGTYRVTEKTAYIRMGPYQSKDLVRTISEGETINVSGSVINSYGNIWLKTSDGYYVHAERLTRSGGEQPQSYYVILDDGSVCSRIKVTNGGSYGNLPTPTKDGYTFDGWFTSVRGGNQVTSTTTVNLTGDQTLYAHWTRNPASYTVTFDANGGSVSQTSMLVTVGSVYGTLPTPTRSGYKFDGWYTSVNGSIRMTSNTIVEPSHYTLYAHWTMDGSYFNCNVGIYCVYGKTVNLYNNPGDSNRVDYFSLGQSVGSTYGVNMPDGSTWYQVSVTSKGNVITVWLKYESDKMTVKSISDTPPDKNAPEYFSCNVGIFTVKGKTVNLYNNPGDSKRVDYFNLGQSVGSSYGVNMPDGTTWYQVSVTSKGNVITVWLKYESDKMTIRNL